VIKTFWQVGDVQLLPGGRWRSQTRTVRAMQDEARSHSCLNVALKDSASALYTELPIALTAIRGTS